MEGVPFRLMLSLLLMASVLTLAFYEIAVFNEFSIRKSFSDDIRNLDQAMKSLSSTGDHGSFTRIKMRIPGNSNFTVDNISNKLTYYFFGEKKEYNVSGTLLWNRFYGPGTYEFE